MRTYLGERVLKTYEVYSPSCPWRLGSFETIEEAESFMTQCELDEVQGTYVTTS
jgi:hypothetical protein